MTSAISLDMHFVTLVLRVIASETNSGRERPSLRLEPCRLDTRRSERLQRHSRREKSRILYA